MLSLFKSICQIRSDWSTFRQISMGIVPVVSYYDIISIHFLKCIFVIYVYIYYYTFIHTNRYANANRFSSIETIIYSTTYIPRIIYPKKKNKNCFFIFISIHSTVLGKLYTFVEFIYFMKTTIIAKCFFS
jgi:hypothetical protein